MTDGAIHGVEQQSLLDGLVPLVALPMLFASALALFGLDALDGPIQVALLVCCGVAALIAMKNGRPFSKVQEAGRGAVASVSGTIFIHCALGRVAPGFNEPSEEAS